MITDVLTIRPDASIVETRAALGERPFAVVVADDGAPLALLSRDDLARGGDAGRVSELAWPPTIVMPDGMTVEEFVASRSVTLLDLADDLAGLVVGQHRPIGVVPIDDVDEHLARHGYRPTSTKMGPLGAAGDAVLAGDERVPLARVACGHCGFVNTLTFIVFGMTPDCTNPDVAAHPLALPRRG
jgi:CBS domain-containing protein